jgi:hypothetical protein
MGRKNKFEFAAQQFSFNFNNSNYEGKPARCKALLITPTDTYDNGLRTAYGTLTGPKKKPLRFASMRNGPILLKWGE